ncbi:MAG: hypothetical protein EA385_15170 [Salinarimonadaceae bacterium]|nr:MAG: hypothetical protein EA385_15170 [Salinarimonadaceae bacterium]
MRAGRIADQYNTLGDHDLDEDLDEALESEAGDVWDIASVRTALVQGYRVLLDTVGREGPRGAGSYWPAFPAEAADLWEQRRTGSNTVGRMRVRIQRTSIEIQQAEAALHWPMRLLADDHNLRVVLQAWALAQAMRIKGRTLCKRRGWAYSTLRERRDRAARIIAEQLNRERVEPW